MTEQRLARVRRVCLSTVAGMGVALSSVVAAPAVQAAVTPPAAACYPLCTPTLSTTTKVVGTGSKVTFILNQYRPGDEVKIVAGTTVATAVIDANGQAKATVVMPKKVGVYTVSATSQSLPGSTAKVNVYIPAVKAPAKCVKKKACVFSFGVAEPKTKVTLLAKGAKVVCKEVTGKYTCTATYAAANAKAAWTLTAGAFKAIGTLKVS